MDGDERVGLFDLVRIGASFRTLPPRDAAADINADGRVDLFDMVMVGRQYGTTGPLAWADPPERPAGDGPSVATGAPGRGEPDSPAASDLPVELWVESAQALYGADLVLAFDPARLRLLDADAASPGTQVELGNAWLGEQGYVALNRLDAEPASDGLQRLRLAASRMQPASPLWGRVGLARLGFEALAEDGQPGPAAWWIESLSLSDDHGRALPLRWEGGTIRVLGRLFLPWLAAMGG